MLSGSVLVIFAYWLRLFSVSILGLCYELNLTSENCIYSVTCTLPFEIIGRHASYSFKISSNTYVYVETQQTTICDIHIIIIITIILGKYDLNFPK